MSQFTLVAQALAADDFVDGLCNTMSILNPDLYIGK